MVVRSMLLPIASRLRRLPGGAVVTIARPLSSSTGRETLWEKNARLREASEKKLVDSRQRLIDDVGNRHEDMSALREAVREKMVTLHPPPATLYSHAQGFLFPAMRTVSLTGGEVTLSGCGSGLFAGRWTLLGCAGSAFAQPMVDAWLRAGEATVAAAEATVEAAAQPSLPSQVQRQWLSFIEGRMLEWFQRPLLTMMRRSVPTERHAVFCCHFGDAREARRAIQMQNKYLGYVCLVDPKGVVRWHVHGSEVPSEPEVDALHSLLRRATSVA